MDQKKPHSQRKPFAGVLLEPIERPDVLVIKAMAKNDPNKFLALMKAAGERVNEQEVARLKALAEHYEVSPALSINDQIFRTLFCLAREFVPGFQFSDERPQRGRPIGKGPKGKDRLGGLDLLNEVDALVSNNHTVASACSIIVKKPGRWKGEKRKSVETAYYDEVNRWAAAKDEFNKHPFYSYLRDVLKRIESLPGPEDLATKILRN